jgi:hypothetical protein
LVDAPFQNPAEGSVVEVEVTDPGHPLFGRRFPLVSVSRLRASGGGHAFVAYQDRMLLKLPVAATSLAPRLPGGVPSKLTVEAMQELIALTEDSGEVPCSSGLNASGHASPRRCGARSPRMSAHSSRR